MKRFAAYTLALLVMGGGAARAQSEMDTDGDGMVSYAELLASVPDVSAATFEAVDTNGDGGLDATELAAAVQAGVLPQG